jgi:hypothetical protein
MPNEVPHLPFLQFLDAVCGLQIFGSLLAKDFYLQIASELASCDFYGGDQPWARPDKQLSI